MKWALPLLALQLSSGCARQVELFPGEADSGAADAGVAWPAWSSYVAKLSLPDCPAAPVLVVNTASTALTGGRTLDDPALAGPELSFPQAMWIAANRLGPDTITFDSTVFPPDSPVTILLAGTDELPPDVGPVCLDGRGSGVVLDWTPEGVACRAGCFWWLTRGSVQVGLTLKHLPMALQVSDAQVAGCRLGNDGERAYNTLRPSAVEAYGGAVIGPGNVFTDPIGIRVLNGATGVRIIGNEMGVDPVTFADLGLIVGVELQGEATLDGNLFGETTAEPVRSTSVATVATLTNNLIGVDRLGAPVERLASGFTLAMGSFDVGPGNVIQGTQSALRVGDGAQVRITRNSISRNGAGIVFLGAAPVDAPALTLADASRVQGTCPVAGEVEVFSDSGDQGTSFLGTATCTAAGAFDLVVSVPGGRNVTATLTDASARTSAFSAPLAVP